MMLGHGANSFEFMTLGLKVCFGVHMHCMKKEIHVPLAGETSYSNFVMENCNAKVEELVSEFVMSQTCIAELHACQAACLRRRCYSDAEMTNEHKYQHIHW